MGKSWNNSSSQWVYMITDNPLNGGPANLTGAMSTINQPERSKREDLTSTSPLPKDLEKRLIEKWERDILS